MGWMGGLGKGLQGYAGILGEQRKLDWQTKQQDVQFQRQKNLEMLRMQNQSAEAQKGRDFDAAQGLLDREQRQSELQARQEFQTGERIAGQEFQAGQKESGMNLNGRSLTRAEYDALDEAGKKAAEFNEVAKLEALYSAKGDQRKQAVADLKSSFFWERANEDEKAMMELAISNPELSSVASAVLKNGKAQSIKPEQLRLAKKEAEASWKELDPEQVARAQKKAKEAGIPTEDVKQFYMSEYIREAFQIPGAPTPSASPVSPETEDAKVPLGEFDESDVPKLAGMSDEARGAYLQRVRTEKTEEEFRRISGLVNSYMADKRPAGMLKTGKQDSGQKMNTRADIIKEFPRNQGAQSNMTDMAYEAMINRELAKRLK